jgi:hypothetical protein
VAAFDPATDVRERNHVKAPLAAILLACLPSLAHADVFGFKDHDGFEKCMSTDHLVEEVKTDKGSQTRLLDEVEIQMRCIDSAVKLLTPLKSKETDLQFIETAKRLTAHENAVDLVGVLADHAVAACNEMTGYTVLTKALSHPKDWGKSVARARVVVKKCLKDNQFKTDFLEEKDSSDSYLAANACQILLEEKLVKSCKGAK